MKFSVGMSAVNFIATNLYAWRNTSFFGKIYDELSSQAQTFVLSIQQNTTPWNAGEKL
jgi:hypothetical protein